MMEDFFTRFEKMFDQALDEALNRVGQKDHAPQVMLKKLMEAAKQEAPRDLPGMTDKEL